MIRRSCPRSRGWPGSTPQSVDAAKLSPATKAALAQNPTDQAAGIKAVSEIVRRLAGDVATIAS